MYILSVCQIYFAKFCCSEVVKALCYKPEGRGFENDEMKDSYLFT
jgi:hypothetical protein